MNPRLALQLFGPFGLRAADGREIALHRKSQALVARLAVAGGRRVARDALTALLWSDTDDARARHSLRQSIHRIRLAFAEAADALVVDHESVGLATAAFAVDVAVFERLAGAGTVDALERAVALYRGDLLEGLVFDAPAFEEWLCLERDRLHEVLFESLCRLLAHQERSDMPEAALRTAKRLLALDPLQEAVHRSLMRLYARAGRFTCAIAQYHECVGLLRRELGAEPESETRALYHGLRAGGRARAEVG